MSDSDSTPPSAVGNEPTEAPVKRPDGVTAEDAERITELAEEVSLSTIRQDVAAIRWMHERHGADAPTDDAGVSRVLGGINQTSDTMAEKKQAVLTKHVRAMVDGLPLKEPDHDAGLWHK